MQVEMPTPRLGALMEAGAIRANKVAAHCDVDQSTVWRWRTGRAAIPDEQKLRLAEFFGVTVPYLMAWDEPTEKAA